MLFLFIYIFYHQSLPMQIMCISLYAVVLFQAARISWKKYFWYLLDEVDNVNPDDIETTDAFLLTKNILPSLDKYVSSICYFHS